MTPLMTASFEGHVDIVRILIEAKAQINTQEEVYMLLLPPENTLHNTSSYTVSLYIAVLGELTVCLYPQTDCTALHLAAQEGKVDVVRLLTEAQAQVNIQDEVYTSTMSCLMIGIGLSRLCRHFLRIIGMH